MGEKSTLPAPAKIAVVIPYYQEEPGILRGAVMSAAAQEGVGALEIIVVDDGSPAPARDDLVDLDLPPHVALALIEQPNRGPGAARNRALRSMSPDAVYVTFLDSDDRWKNSHLTNGQLALESGYDIYFSDYWLSERNTSLFAQSGYALLDQTDYGENSQLCLLRSSAKADLIHGTFRLHISTMVYRLKVLENIYVPESFWIGEDLAFFLTAVQEAGRIALSSKVEAFSVPGVNIYKKAGWDAPNIIWMLLEEAKSRRWISNNINMTTDEKQANRTRSHQIRLDLLRNTLHELRNGRAFRNRNIPRFLALDPKSLWYILPVAASQIYKKIR